MRGAGGTRSFINRDGHNYLYEHGKDERLPGVKTFIERRSENGPAS